MWSKCKAQKDCQRGKNPETSAELHKHKSEVTLWVLFVEHARGWEFCPIYQQKQLRSVPNKSGLQGVFDLSSNIYACIYIYIYLFIYLLIYSCIYSSIYSFVITSLIVFTIVLIMIVVIYFRSSLTLSPLKRSPTTNVNHYHISASPLEKAARSNEEQFGYPGFAHIIKIHGRSCTSRPPWKPQYEFHCNDSTSLQMKSFKKLPSEAFGRGTHAESQQEHLQGNELIRVRLCFKLKWACHLESSFPRVMPDLRCNCN